MALSQVESVRDGASRAVYEPEALVSVIGAILTRHPQPPAGAAGTSPTTTPGPRTFHPVTA